MLINSKNDSMTPRKKFRNLANKFPILTKEEVDILVEKTIVDEFKKGTTLLKEGQIPTKCYMIVEGCVREYIIKDGEDKSTAFFMEGDTFTPQSGEGQPSKHYWECTEDCILTISNKSYEEEIRAALPRLNDVFQGIAIEKINRAKEEWTLFVTSTPEERYLNLLKTKPQLLGKIPQHQIASYLGIKPQSLSRIRKRLVNK